MCYILYGAVNREIDASDLERITKSSGFTFRKGTKHDVKMCVIGKAYDYRVTDWVCDCDFPVGAKDPERPELKKLAAVLNALRSARNAKYVYLCKTWAGTRNKTEETVSGEALDLPAFLADMKLNCLYRIDLSPAAA